jgi:hypothetical protein
MEDPEAIEIIELFAFMRIPVGRGIESNGHALAAAHRRSTWRRNLCIERHFHTRNSIRRVHSMSI